MPTFGSSVSRGTGPSYTSGANGVNPLIPEDVSREIIKGVTHKSAVLEMFKHRQMSTAQQRMPVLATKPAAYFVSGDVGLKQTSNASWENKFLDAEEIAVIIPIPEKVLDDAAYDVWAELKPEIEEAVGIALDAAVFFGIDKPTSWPTAIAPAAIAAGNTVTRGTGIDIADNLNTALAAVEGDGFVPSGWWMRVDMQGILRNLREATTNGFLFLPNNPGLENTVFSGTVFGKKAVTSMSGVFEQQTGANKVMALTGDFSQGIVGIRQDLTFKVLDQAPIFDGDGNLMFNLAQQDMIALRVVARFAFQVPNPLNRLNTDSATRYPFAVVRNT